MVRVPTKHLGHISLLSQTREQEIGLEMEQPRLEQLPLWDAPMLKWLNTLYHNIGLYAYSS